MSTWPRGVILGAFLVLVSTLGLIASRLNDIRDQLHEINLSLIHYGPTR